MTKSKKYGTSISINNDFEAALKEYVAQNEEYKYAPLAVLAKELMVEGLEKRTGQGYKYLLK